MKKSIIIKIVFLLLLGQLVFPRTTYAYLDPGTGSYVIQILAASFFAGLYMVKRFWGNIKDFLFLFFSKAKKKETKPKSHEEK